MDAKSGYNIFLSGDVTRSSPVLYREYSVQDENLVLRFSLLSMEESTLLFAFFFDFCFVANFPRGVLGTKVNPGYVSDTSDTC